MRSPRVQVEELDAEQLADRLAELQPQLEHAERDQDVARALRLRVAAEDLFAELARRRNGSPA
ncbi:MAG: hypothetical protein ACLPTJ_16230 [Solirubrobacteraceae bacterium]